MQLWVAGEPVSTLRAWTITVWLRIRNCGDVVSTTVISNGASVSLPAVSTAVQLTGVSPSGKDAPGPGVQVMSAFIITPETSSTADGMA